MNKEKLQRIILKKEYGDNWISAFNKMEQEYFEIILDIIDNYLNEKYKATYDVTNEIYSINSELIKFVDIITVENIKQKFNRIELLEKNFSNIRQVISAIQNDNIFELQKKTIDEFKDLKEKQIKKLGMYLIANNPKTENDKIIKRVDVIVARGENIIKQFITDEFGKDNMVLINEIYDIDKNLKIIANFILENFKCENKEISVSRLENKISKIFDYKEMVKLAEINGYCKARQNGDHIIFTHKISHKAVPIPQHDLGYGLMCKIQKQIKENKK